MSHQILISDRRRPEIGGTDLSRHGSSKLQLFLGEIKANVGRSA